MPYITMGIAYDRVVAPKLGLPIDEAKIKSFMARARTCLAEISRLVGDQEFLAGPSVSIADLMLPPHLAFFSIAPEGTDLLASFPTLTAWLDRMSLLPSLINTTPEKLTTLAQLSAG
jgi:glutathione S-transferase